MNDKILRIRVTPPKGSVKDVLFFVDQEISGRNDKLFKPPFDEFYILDKDVYKIGATGTAIIRDIFKIESVSEVELYRYSLRVTKDQSSSFDKVISATVLLLQNILEPECSMEMCRTTLGEDEGTNYEFCTPESYKSTILFDSTSKSDAKSVNSGNSNHTKTSKILNSLKVKTSSFLNKTYQKTVLVLGRAKKLFKK